MKYDICFKIDPTHSPVELEQVVDYLTETLCYPAETDLTNNSVFWICNIQDDQSSVEQLAEEICSDLKTEYGLNFLFQVF